MKAEIITSLQNQRVKRLVQLQQKSAVRRKAGLFVVEGRVAEGLREVQHCVEGGFEIVTLYFCRAMLCDEMLDTLFQSCAGADCYEVTPEVYEKMAYRGTTEGVMAEVRARYLILEDLKLSESPLVVVLESVEKPGNLGAVLRSADAAGVDAVLVCDALTDLYNPNLIRASLGAAFTVPVVTCSSGDAIVYLKEHNVQILTAQLQDSNLYYDTDMRRGTALVMGTESTGLTDVWRQAADAHIRIPMLGRLDSLNVSVSAAILLFEAVRQRESKI